MHKCIKFFTLTLLCSSLIITISSCNKDEDTLPEVTNLELKNAPTKMDYYEGDILDLSGLIVTLSMDNGESEDKAFENFESNGITCSPSNGTELTKQPNVIITHTASGKSINVTANYMIVTDADDNDYQVVKIGEQFWMAENLKTTKYNDGTAIPLVVDNTEWSNITTPGYCWYDNDEASNKNIYGGLYNYYTVNTNKLCPTGWHVPSDEEWLTMIDYLGDINVAGGKLKERGLTHWNSPNTGATNESGFSALPGGYRHADATFYYNSNYGYWWSTTAYSLTKILYSRTDYNANSVFSGNSSMETGFSIRCIKD